MHSSLDIERSLLETVQEARDLYVSDVVPRLTVPPTPLEFQKNWVAPNRPFIVEGGAYDWPACSKWSSKYFREHLPNKMMTVAVTPNGLADAVDNGRFVLPEERQMSFTDFLNKLEEETGDVFYIQKQNSNLTYDLPELLIDVPKDITWATKALGALPDAVNFWMGSARSTTSMHKDHYENLYVVIKGAKEFILHPPVDRPFIPHKNYPQAQYLRARHAWTAVDVPGEPIPWVSIDPANPNIEQYPAYQHAKKVKCVVNAGDIFYLPALWFHHVSQTNDTIAVNYWYDMEFDAKYSLFQTLDRFSKFLDR